VVTMTRTVARGMEMLSPMTAAPAGPTSQSPAGSKRALLRIAENLRLTGRGHGPDHAYDGLMCSLTTTVAERSALDISGLMRSDMP
jgi:hypothetical protein